MGSTDSHRHLDALTALGFDPNAVLIREPRVLLDPKFIGALHAELENEFGAEEGAVTLVQIGFLHGLQSAARALESAVTSGGPGAARPMAPPLAIRLKLQPRAHPPGAIEIHGSWPERCEASARLARRGASETCGCFLSAGFTSGWLSGVLDASILAMETSCSATGAEGCHFVAREEEAWRAQRDERAEATLDGLPFEAFRELIGAGLAAHPQPAAEPVAGFEPDPTAVHIWGPVMVVPFSGGDEALHAIDLIGRDPGASQVSVVVVDLTGAVVDEGFGAVTLEQIVDTVEILGAETIFAGVSPLSQRAVADLDRQPLRVLKDVHEAIAAAFQIARSQRRSL